MATLKTNHRIPTNASQPPIRQRQGRLQSSLAAWVFGLSLLAIGSGTPGLESAQANPPNQNSEEYVLDVKLRDTDWSFNLTLENTSENKHISHLQIEPTTSYVNLPLDGYVKCNKNMEQFSHAFAFWGTVKLVDNAVVPFDVLYADDYEPLWEIPPKKKNGYTISNFGGNEAPFLTPLTSIRDGSANIRLRPVEELNQQMEQWIQDTGRSRIDYLRRDHHFTVLRYISLGAYCKNEDTGLTGGGYDTVLMPINVKYKGDPDLLPDPGVEGEQPDGLAIPFQVTAASVRTQFWDENYEGPCPTDLEFQVKIETVGKGMMEYRMVNHLGGKSPIYQAWFENGGVHYDNFSHEVDDGRPSPGDGIVDEWANPDAGHDGPVDDYAHETSDETQFNSWRIEIVSPNAMMSDEHFYYWTCTPQRPDGERPGEVTHDRGPQGPW